MNLSVNVEVVPTISLTLSSTDTWKKIGCIREMLTLMASRSLKIPQRTVNVKG